MQERRTQEGYKLRVYFDAIKEAKAMSDEEWTNAWAVSGSNAPYMPKSVWIAYLESCAMKEAEKLVGREAA